MTLDEARTLREAAGQPTEWPADIHPPLSRLALTRIVGTECEEQQIQVAAWDSVLLGHPLDDSSVLDDVVEGVAELLQINLVGDRLPNRFDHFVALVEEEFLTQWRGLVGMNLSDAQLIDMIGRAVGEPLNGDEAIIELIPEAQLAGFWQKLPEPWGSLWPSVSMQTIWWPLSERTWGALGGFSVLTYLLWKNVDVSIGSRLILSAIALWLCWTFVVEQPIKPVWPKSLVTVRDVAHAMLSELREQEAHWELLEREWGPNRFLEAQIG
ncbi:hypothetical protein [Armatimonas sp.]|uniref:hypothetical protein n=1 Tax=Armatimonas sp. TaxID=1872638 RepID=UPI00375167B3